MLELGDFVYNTLKKEYGEVVALTDGNMYGVMYDTYNESRHDLDYESRKNFSKYTFSSKAPFCKDGHGWYEFKDDLIKVSENKQYLLF